MAIMDFCSERLSGTEFARLPTVSWPSYQSQSPAQSPEAGVCRNDSGTCEQACEQQIPMPAPRGYGSRHNTQNRTFH